MLSIDDTVKWKVYDAIAMMETSLDNGGIPVENVDSSSCTASLEPTERTGSWLRNCSCPRYSSELRLWTVLHAVLTASIMTFLVGITLAFSSPALLELTQLQDLQFRFNTGLADLFGASSILGAIFGGPIAGYVCDSMGRKFGLVVNSGPYLVGYFVILSSYLAANGIIFKTTLMVGRFFTGVGMGWSYAVVPIYISEVAPTELRSMLGTFSELSLTLGILILYGLGAVPGFQYHELALLQVAILVLFMFLVVLVPETPRWLLLKLKDTPRTIAALKYLRGPDCQSRIKLELTSIQTSLPKKKLSITDKLRLLLFQRKHLVPFLLLVFLYMFQHLCGGGSAVVAYAAQILQSAGSTNPDLTSACAVGTSLVVATVLASVLIERMGRKLLLSVSAAGMLAGSLVLTCHSFFTRPTACSSNSSTTIVAPAEEEELCNPQLLPLAVVGIIVFVLSFSFGLGPVPWVMLPEYLPLQVRGVAGGAVVASNWIATAIITGGFLSYMKLVGAMFTWLTLAGINLMGLAIVVLFIRETKGKSLEEVEQLFVGKNKCSFLM